MSEKVNYALITYQLVVSCSFALTGLGTKQFLCMPNDVFHKMVSCR